MRCYVDVSVLIDEYNALKRKYDVLDESYDGLIEENRMLNDKLWDLKESVSLREHTALQRKYDTLKYQYYDLNEAYKELIEENEKLEKESDLKYDSGMVDDLLEKIDELNAEKHDLEVTVGTLMFVLGVRK